jgi:2-keto-4-pentenoate hydratase/2-oxohepta-3-ene-1,7-dioic acid hydratase in catechol pathway
LKLATFRLNGINRIAIVHDRNQKLFDLAKAAERDGDRDPVFASMTSLIDAGDAALDRASRLFDRRSSEADLSLDMAKVQLLAPVPEPRQMRDGMSFPRHIVQAPRGYLWLKARLDGDQDELKRLEAEQLPDVPAIFRQQPLYYITNRFSVRGPDTTVIWPSYSQQMDYELEFGIFTKKKGSNISKKTASEHIFGYTIFNDFSARDAQRKEMEGRLGPKKLRRRQRDWPVDRHARRDRRSVQPQCASSCKRRDTFERDDAGYAVFL